MATEVATLTFRANTKEIEAAHRELVKLNKQGKVTDKTLRDFEKSMAAALKPTEQMPGALGNVGRRAGQAGIQFQQLVGQVQAGTDPMIALSQQAADLGFVLGVPLLGAIAGITASLAGPLVTSLLASNDAMSESTKFLKDYEEGFDKLGEAQKRVLTNMLQIEIEQQRDAIKQLNDVIKQNSGVMTQFIADSTSEVMMAEQVTKQTKEQALAQDEARAAIELANDKITVATEKIEILTGKRQEETDAIKQANEALSDYIARQELISKTKDMSIPAKLLADATARAAEAGRELTKEERKRLLVAGVRLQQIEDEKIARKIADAEAKGSQQVISAMRRKAHQEQLAAISAERKAKQLEDQNVLKLVQKMTAAEAKLRSDGLLDVEKDEFDTYRRRQAKLEEFNQKQLITEKRYNEARKNLETQARDHAIQSSGDALNALAAHNRTAFHAAKAFNIGQAIMNTYTGATKALAAYPPPFNFIMAAAVVASGLAQVQTIRAQQYQGRALGGQVRSGESYVVGERGPEVLTMGSSGRIIPNDKIGGAGQTVNKVANVTFQISTVDARGFDSLLQSRKGQIIGMINTAMNERGSRGLT